MNHIRTYSFILTVISIFALSFHTDAVAVETCGEWIAKAVSVQGEVHARTQDENQWASVQMNNTFCAGDMLRVQEKSRAAIVLINDTVIRLDQNTTITFTRVEKKKSSVLDIIKGAVHFISRVPRTLKVNTPFVNGNVEGTEFLVRVFKDHTFMTVYEGRVLAANDSGSLTLTGTQSAIAESGKAPVLKTVVQSKDAVQWALYYPPVLNVRTLSYSDTDTGWRAAVKESSRHYWKGDLASAFSSINSITAKVSDHQFYTYKAALLLTVGRVDDALQNINQAFTIHPNNTTALALQSIIAVVHNESGNALTLANKAIEENPDSATAHIALSYAEQANFNLEASRKSLQKAVKLDPDNGLAWARLAELWQSFHELDKAMDAAHRAVSLHPDLARTQTVLGYSYLSRIATRKAIINFEKAITLDQADPLPRLGLGLAQIREGKLKEGRENIEIAASLDPGNSLIRSYMGKAYFEEKRDKLAKDQYDMAQSLDPKDPTPFFYDAIRKQSINRPVEALHNLQKAIDLNDNRAVYRSKLLLDNDLAVRSASLARIYSDLGFQHLALVEGWKSINIDPGNYSAHRFLADSYSARPRHEIARVSELLQYQLMQPINITPVQPSLAESNLFILEGAGPGDPSFNEFNPLFNQNRIALQLSGIAGLNSTFGDEVVVSGVFDKVSLSAGQFHYETDGYRSNNDQDRNIYNFYVQASLTHKTSIFAEFRSTNTEKGDLRLNFDPDDFSPDLRETEDSDSSRFGIRHSLTSRSQIIATVIYKDVNLSLHDIHPIIPADIDFITNHEGYMTEVQHIYRPDSYKIISGAGYVSTDTKEDFTFGSSPAEIEEVDVEHINFYIYSQINYPHRMIWTLGGSSDFFEGRDDIDEDQFNPKFGITWTPLRETTLRAAAFRVLTRTLYSEQTIEPTQVAGFNQFFDDAEGTDSWRYGAAIDQQFTDKLYGGLEFSSRNLEVPYLFQNVDDAPPGPPPSGPPPPGPPPPGPPPPPPASPVTSLEKANWDEYLGRAYIYWTPHPFITLSVEYQYEQFDRDEEFAAGIEEVKTHIMPLGLSFFHPTGFSAKLKATYRNQEGDFIPAVLTTDASSISGSDRFWIFDASLRYRLPKRRGIISIETKNLFDKSFEFQDTDPARPLIQPEHITIAKFTLAL